MNDNELKLNTGSIVQITGPVVDVCFEKDKLPRIKEKLYVDIKKRHI